MNISRENRVFGNPGISTKYPTFNKFDGPFSPIIDETNQIIKINPESYIFKNMSFDSFIDISNRDMAIPANGDILWKVWLEVFFESGAVTAANYNYSNVWWRNYPLMQEYNEVDIAPATPLTQLALRIPVFTITTLNRYQGNGTIFNTENDSFIIKRHIINDLILFQTCTGFIFLPSPATPPPASLEGPEEE